ncbi:hypothetical protein Sjap_022105 [Stephania japonica]|uniref:Uncharacterized protein n=1 Tax=Stephania japonica TaxID=461633 RepID=A0AAP0EVH1_9MAGN
MNLFRFIEDHDSLINVLVLLLKIYITKSWSGISLKTQELYVMVLLARYLDLCRGHRAISHGIGLKKIRLYCNHKEEAVSISNEEIVDGDANIDEEMVDANIDEDEEMVDANISDEDVEMVDANISDEDVEMVDANIDD